MSFDFVLKDIFRARKTSLKFILTLGMFVGFFTFFALLSHNLGLIAFGADLELFTRTLYLLFQQYTTLTLGLMFVTCLVVAFSVSWTLLAHKTRNIAVMKAVGALPRRLYNFYTKELLLLAACGVLVGWIGGIVGYTVVYAIGRAFYPGITFTIDWLWTPFLYLATLFVVWVTGGYYLSRLSKRTVVQTMTANVPNMPAPSKFTPVPRLLMRLGPNLKLATRNLVRHVKDFYRHFVYLGLVLSIVFSIGLGLVTLGTTTRSYFPGSDQGHVLAVGHQNILPAYQNMYDVFRGQPAANYSAVNFTASDFMFNASDVETLLASNAGLAPESARVDPRLLLYTRVQERPTLKPEYQLIGNETYITTYSWVGQNREATVPVVGYDLERLTFRDQYFTEGTLPAVNNTLNVSVGDSLSRTLFEDVFFQDLQVFYGTTNRTFRVSGVIIDSFFGGNTVYAGLETVRQMAGIDSGLVNLVLVPLTQATPVTALDALETAIQARFGPQFTVVDLTPTLSANRESVRSVERIYGVVLVALVAVAAIAILQYQRGSLEGKIKDFATMKVLGASGKRVSRVIFWEMFLIILAGAFLALGISMLFVQFAFLKDAILPPLYVPFAIFGAILLLLNLINAAALRSVRKRLQQPVALLRER